MRNWKNFSFEVRDVFVISRIGDEPFAFKYRISFNGEIEKMDELYESVPGRLPQSAYVHTHVSKSALESKRARACIHSTTNLLW